MLGPCESQEQFAQPQPTEKLFRSHPKLAPQPPAGNNTLTLGFVSRAEKYYHK